MSRHWILASGLLCLAPLFAGSAAAGAKPAAKEEAKPAEKPRVEVVFCLDTTGSMTGLIDAAKKKIWAISNQITTLKPTPHVKVGLVAYRDRGDSYITQVHDLTDDLDGVYAKLMGFKADEGGDEPESVNQALYDAVHKIAWSKDKKTLRMIFLVGDAPPHMDYPDDVKYPETCKEALKRDIVINTVLCGSSASAKEHWLKICRATEGSFVQIEADGGPVVAVATPFDKELAELNAKISDTTLVWGSMEVQKENKDLARKNKDLGLIAAAERAGFYARNNEGLVTYCLLNGLKEGKVKLEDLKKDELPDQLKGKTLEEQKAYVSKLQKERDVMTQRVIELDRRRSDFIAKKQAEDARLAPATAFDTNVLRIVETQAARRR
ncbi:MAG: vWA domain-containing protein [Gemmataceae bacterium]